MTIRRSNNNSRPGKTKRKRPGNSRSRLRFTDQVVVSASRVEQEIVNAPAAVTVIGSAQLEAQSGADYSDKRSVRRRG